ncbi:translation initiation factor IF-2 associated domain-containing protein, partial [Ideonella sp.]|uniref:translation initiation factor IF-2 associated domain-containing protein n=1 Tax=Ideonella sp. TaxID=1929293 RepID=UPI003BB6F7A5
MAVTTVAQLAAELNRPAATLLEQLKSAGVAKISPDDSLNESDKERLLDHLRTSHGTVAGADRKKITLTRKSTSEIKQADASGKARTIQVEVRKKRTFIKREDGTSDDDGSAAAAEEAELSRREEEARHQAEQLRIQEAELAEKRRLREEQERAEREAAAKAAAEAAAARAAAEAAAALQAEEAAKAAAAEAAAAKAALAAATPRPKPGSRVSMVPPKPAAAPAPAPAPVVEAVAAPVAAPVAPVAPAPVAE